MKFAVSLWSLSLLAGVFASNVLDLSNEGAFNEVIGKGKPGLVELYVAFAPVEIIILTFLVASRRGGTSYFQ
jgi:hypothetical protein